MTKRLIPVLMAIVCSSGSLLFGGFASTEVFLPAVGRVAGKNGAQFYTTVWATNLTSAPQTFTFRFLKGGQSNLAAASFDDTLAPGQTRMYENVVETKLGLANTLGAARITSAGEIFVSERIYDQAPGDDLGKTVGLFFAGVPKTFSISAGQSASIQGVNQGGSEDFRYNFALVETGGGSPTVGIQVFDGNGALLGQRSYPMLPYEQLQPAASVRAPVSPFRLATPDAAAPPSRLSWKLISNPEESWEPLATCAPARSTEPVPPVTVAVIRALVVAIPGTTSLTAG